MGIDTLYSLRQDAPAEVYYHRGDPHDSRLGEAVSTDLTAYDQADIVLLGCPQDQGVQRNQGRPGAADAPQAIRAQLYRLGLWGLEELTFFDLGDTKVHGSLEDIHARQQALVTQVMQDGKRLIALGGGNDLSYPDVVGLAATGKTLLALNIDAHFDVRTDTPRNSGTPYRQLLQQSIISSDKFFEIGYQPYANAATYARDLAHAGVTCLSCAEVQAQGVRNALAPILATSADAIFWGVDMDVVTAGDAPGVSAPNPAGLRANELIEVARLAGEDPRSRIFEITEVNVTYDLDNRTCRLAAVAIWHFLQHIALHTFSKQ